MNFYNAVSFFFLACEASRNHLSSIDAVQALDATDEYSYHRERCQSYLPSSPAGERLGILGSLDIIGNWERLLPLSQCQDMIQEYSRALFHDCSIILDLKTERFSFMNDSEVVNNALNALSTLDGIDADGQKVVKFLIYL